MKKAIPWIVSIILFLIGMANSVNSAVGGLLAIIAALLFMPPVIKILASKKQFVFLTKNAWSIKVIAAVLVLISFGFVGEAKDEKLIASYNADPIKALSEARKALEQKDFVMAKIRTETYLKVLPNNPELKSLIVQIDSEKAEADKQAELNKQQVKANAVAPKTESVEVSDVEVSDPDDVGRCLGFLALLSVKEGAGAMTKGNNSYVSFYNAPYEKIQKISKEQNSCLATVNSPEDLVPCIKNYNDYEKKLFSGYSYGISDYLNARDRGKVDVGVYALGCSK
jgi:hypothetical protein